MTKLPEKALQADARNDQSSSQLAKSGSKSHDLLVGTARFVRRTVEKALYQQFVDADSDDLDKEPVVAAGNAPIGRRSVGDSSSEGADAVEREKYEQQCRLRDYHYQELEDEYGSKRSTRMSLEPLQWDAALGDSSDVSNGMDRDVTEKYHHHHRRDDLHDDGYGESSPKLPLHHTLSPPGQQVAPPVDQHDRIVGHEFGVKPLLDDDELSDIEGGGKPLAVTNPFLGRDEQLSQCSSAMSTGSVTMSPLSSLSPVDIVTRDVFGAAPFHRKSHKKRGKLLLGSPPQSGAVSTRPDTYRSVLTAGPDVVRVAQKDAGGSLMTHGLSPDMTAARSMSQSPQHTTNDDLLKHVASPVDADLFGFGNFATFSTNQPPQPVACFRQQMAQQYSKATSPTNRTVTSVDFEVDPFGVVPFTTDTFHTDPTQTRLMPGSAVCSNAESRVNACHYASGQGIASCGIMPRRHRRHSSSDSHSSNSEMSPHSTKRDAQKITMCYSKSSDLLQDENVDALPSGDFSYSSLKKSKLKARKTSKPSAEFANLGFMDDSEREAELAAMKCGIIEHLPVNSTMHQSLYLEPLKSNDIGNNYLPSVDDGVTPSDSNHTLPRAKKHLAMPQGQRPTSNMAADFFQG